MKVKVRWRKGRWEGRKGKVFKEREQTKQSLGVQSAPEAKRDRQSCVSRGIEATHEEVMLDEWGTSYTRDESANDQDERRDEEVDVNV